MIAEFDGCVLDTASQQLWRDGNPVHVEPQVLAVLEYLMAHRNRMVSKIELLDEVWGDRFVSESALTSRIKLVRKACGDSGREQRIVKTIHSRGYRFVAEVIDRESSASARVPDVVGAPASTPDGLREPSGVFGRDTELAKLDQALEQTDRGTRTAVFIRGGLGSGKSMLIAELIERHDHLDEWLVLQGRCMQTRGAVEPYFCLFDAFGHLARVEPELVRDTLDRVAPSWLAQMPALVGVGISEDLERRLLGSNSARMLREGAEAIEVLARTRPTLLLLEDLQWADDCTLDVIDLLVQRRDATRLLLLGTAGAEHSDADLLIATAMATGIATELRLGRIDDDAVEDLVRARFGGAQVPDELIRIVIDRCDGVPLFASEILTTWIREGHVEVVGAEVSIRSSPVALRATVPATLPGLLERELRALGSEELTVLEACAVMGDSFDGASVAAGAGSTLPDIERLLAGMADRRGLFVAEGAVSYPDGTVAASYSFTHRLYRQVVHDRIPASRRALLHGRIGVRLEQGYQGRSEAPVAALAEHFIQAGDHPRAVEYLRRVGEQAADRNAHDHAADMLATALATVDQLAEGADRDAAELKIRMSLGPALVATRGWFDQSVSANYETALALCHGLECAEAAAARYGLATISELRGDFQRTEALLTDVLASESDSELAMAAYELVACSTFHQGAFDRSLENASRVLETWDEDTYSVLMARIAEHPASSCNSWSSLASWCLGHSDESLRQADRAVRLGEQNLYALSTATQQRAMLHQIRNEPEWCIEWAERTREVGREQNYTMRIIQADIYKGWALGVTGSTDEGMRLVAHGLAQFRAENATLNEAYYLGLYADTALHGGQPALALELLDEALERMHATTRNYFFQSELHRLRARAYLRLERPDAVAMARSELERSHAVADDQGSPALAMRSVADRVELEAAYGDAAPWREQLTVLLSRFDGQEPTPDIIRARRLSES